MSKIYFLTGSQFLYGEESVKKVDEDAKIISDYLNSNIAKTDIVYFPSIKDNYLSKRDFI